MLVFENSRKVQILNAFLLRLTFVIEEYIMYTVYHIPNSSIAFECFILFLLLDYYECDKSKILNIQ